MSQILWASESAQSLAGRWVQPCQLQTQREEVFAANTAVLTENYYYKKDCTQPLMSIRNSGDVVITEEHMDFTFQEIGITLKDQMMIDDFNGREVCGFKNWTLYKEKIVTGMWCAIITGAKAMKMSDVGSQRFGIYKKTGDLLYFGRLEPGHDALSPERRPVTLDPRFYIRTPAE